jgi:hypothetical protein
MTVPRFEVLQLGESRLPLDLGEQLGGARGVGLLKVSGSPPRGGGFPARLRTPRGLRRRGHLDTRSLFETSVHLFSFARGSV